MLHQSDCRIIINNQLPSRKYSDNWVTFSYCLLLYFLQDFIVISLINDFYLDGKEYVIDENEEEKNNNLSEIEEKIVKILDQKIRPAVARDGGDIKFKEFKDGIVKVQLQGSCSGCPSSTMTLKQGVQNLL